MLAVQRTCDKSWWGSKKIRENRLKRRWENTHKCFCERNRANTPQLIQMDEYFLISVRIEFVPKKTHTSIYLGQREPIYILLFWLDLRTWNLYMRFCTLVLFELWCLCARIRLYGIQQVESTHWRVMNVQTRYVEVSGTAVQLPLCVLCAYFMLFQCVQRSTSIQCVKQWH